MYRERRRKSKLEQEGGGRGVSKVERKVCGEGGRGKVEGGEKEMKERRTRRRKEEEQKEGGKKGRMIEKERLQEEKKVK